MAVKSLQEAVDNDCAPNAVQSLTDALEDKWKRLHELDEEVLADIDDDSFDDEYDRIEQYREDVIKTISIANSHVMARRSPQTPLVAAVTNPVSLPKLNMPEISWAYLEWRPFWS